MSLRWPQGDALDRIGPHSAAFTKALLDAFNDPAADPDHNGLISTNALAHYLAQQVASLTGGAQTPAWRSATTAPCSQPGC